MKYTTAEKIKLGKIAKFPKEVKQEIIQRDNNKCVICGGTYLLQCHHVLFGLDKKVNEKHNTKYNGVLVDQKCHEIIHGCKQGTGLRQKVIDYVNNLYKK